MTFTVCAPLKSANGMVRPCSCPASVRNWQGAPKTRSTPMSQTLNTAIAVIGIDIGKELVPHRWPRCARGDRAAAEVVAWPGRGAVRQTCRRASSAWKPVSARNHLGRKLRGFGHDARLMPAKYVRPYSKGQEERLPRCRGDRRGGATADDEVRSDEDCRSARPAGAPSCARTTGQPAHRHQSNQIRAFLLERGIAVRQGQRFLRAGLPDILAAPSNVLSPRMVRVIENLAGDWRRPR